MTISELYFNKNIKTPKLHIFKYESEIICYSFIKLWGLEADPSALSEEFFNQFQILQNDVDATTPFSYEPHLSAEENALKTSLKLLNANLLNTYNQEELKLGVEFSALCLKNDCLFWISTGQPHILLHRQSTGLVKLSGRNDLSFDYHNSSQSPLPKNVLGMYKTTDSIIDKIKLQKTDSLYLLNRPYISPTIFALNLDEINLQSIAKKLSKDNKQLSFYLAQLSLSTT